MSDLEVTESAGEWVAIAMPGTVFENQRRIVEELTKGDGNTAKVVEGVDGNGNKQALVFIKSYSP